MSVSAFMLGLAFDTTLGHGICNQPLDADIPIAIHTNADFAVVDALTRALNLLAQEAPAR